MSYAHVAALATNTYCAARFDGGAKMASTWFNGAWADAFDHKGYITHKFFPSDLYDNQLGLPPGSGTYAAWVMNDGSLVLRTCEGRLAFTAEIEGKWTAHWCDEFNWNTLPDKYKHHKPLY